MAVIAGSNRDTTPKQRKTPTEGSSSRLRRPESSGTSPAGGAPKRTGAGSPPSPAPSSSSPARLKSSSPALSSPPQGVTSAPPASAPRNGNSSVELGVDYALGDIDFTGGAGATAEIRFAHDPGQGATPPSGSGQIERDGQLINPSDNHLYELAEQAEARAAGPERSYIERDGQLIDPSDNHLYELAEQAEARAAAMEAEQATGGLPGEEESFVLGVGDPDNPFPEHNATVVDVTPWDGTGGEPNDHVEGILLNQGYTVEEIYAPNDEGLTLVDQVAQANDLEDPNLIHPGDSLVVPTTADPTPLRDTIVNEAHPFGGGDPLVTEGSDQGEDIVVTGSDEGEVINVFAGDGDDNITITGGGGNDDIYLATEGGADQAMIDAGTGNDSVTIDLIGGSGGEQIRVSGGEGHDEAVVLLEGGASVEFNEESGENRLITDSGAEVVFQDDVATLTTSNGEEQVSYVQDENGRFVEFDPEAEAINPGTVDGTQVLDAAVAVADGLTNAAEAVGDVIVAAGGLVQDLKDTVFGRNRDSDAVGGGGGGGGGGGSSSF